MPALVLALAFGAVTACHDLESVGPTATVYFQLDAPLCSSVLPVRFYIDSLPVGTDTFRVHLAPDHTISRGFHTPAGPHRLGAQVVGGFVWPDTLVDLASGAALTRLLPFYCS